METDVTFEYRQAELAELIDYRALAFLVMEEERQPETSEVSITFVTDDEIHRLNSEFRGIDRPTDVLSFECDGVDDQWDGPGGDGDVYLLGDIVIAPDVAERQAPSYGLSLAQEMSLLLVHGMLHLCGYDHIEEAEAQAMEQRERDLLTRFWGHPFKRTLAEES